MPFIRPLAVPRRPRLVSGSIPVLVIAMMAGALNWVGAQDPATPQGTASTPDKKDAPPGKNIPLPPARPQTIRTTDGLDLSASYYAPLPEVDRLASVLLIHDIGGSHASVEPLAQLLQWAGCDVLSPDLRGHGESLFPASGPGSSRNETEKNKQRPLRKPDFDMIVASSPNQQVREQASIQGDIEASLLRLLDLTGPDRRPVFIVGCGLGGTLATLWTVSDYAWRDLTDGQQGRFVKGLVLVSPLWAEKGINIKPALDTPPLRDALPVMILAGSEDKNAGKVFDYFKKLRPDQCSTTFVAKTGDDDKKQKKLTVFFLAYNSPLQSDKLAIERSMNPPPARFMVEFFRRESR